MGAEPQVRQRVRQNREARGCRQPFKRICTESLVGRPSDDEASFGGLKCVLHAAHCLLVRCLDALLVVTNGPSRPILAPLSPPAQSAGTPAGSSSASASAPWLPEPAFGELGRGRHRTLRECAGRRGPQHPDVPWLGLRLCCRDTDGQRRRQFLLIDSRFAPLSMSSGGRSAVSRSSGTPDWLASMTAGW